MCKPSPTQLAVLYVTHCNQLLTLSSYEDASLKRVQ
jgi:hypothetical protein